MKRLTDRMELSLQMVHAFAAAFTIAFGVGLMFAIGRGREHLAGRLLVAIVACAALGGIDTAAYRRFAVWTAVGSLGAWVLLLATAWLL